MHNPKLSCTFAEEIIKTKNTMKKYVVASISFFDNEIKQTIQESNNELSAFKQHMLSLCTSEKGLESEKEWQNDEEYPQTYEELLKEIPNWDMDCSVIEI